MHKHLLRFLTICVFLTYVCISFSSCVSLKSLKLFQDIPDSAKLNAIKLPKFVPPVIHVDDIISVSIVTNDISVSNSLNAANSLSVATTAGGGGADNGYLVNKDGFIEMPEIGKIKVSGSSMVQAQDAIKARAAQFFKDPIIVVKNKNLKFTLLGEITRPGTFNIANDKFTIMDALAYSGDFTNFGRRDNVLLLRQNDDSTLSSIRIDLRDSRWLRSPYYYLQNNDVIYVEPNKGKTVAADQIFSRNVSFIGIGLSLFTTLFVVFRR